MRSKIFNCIVKQIKELLIKYCFDITEFTFEQCKCIVHIYHCEKLVIDVSIKGFKCCDICNKKEDWTDYLTKLVQDYHSTYSKKCCETTTCESTEPSCQELCTDTDTDTDSRQELCQVPCADTCTNNCVELCRPCEALENIQIINCYNETIDPCADTVVFDRLDWKSPNFNKRCALFKLPEKACEGKKIIFYNHHRSINILQHQDPHGKNCVHTCPQPPATSNAEFWHITLHDHDDFVELQWIDYNFGWTIVRQNGHVNIQSFRSHPPKYLYTLCTFRRMPNIPEDAKDYVATIDTHPQSPTYGTIVNIALGADISEYHHGDLLNIDGQHFLAAPGLQFDNSYADFFSLKSERAPVLSYSVTPQEIEEVEGGAGALHTTHINPHTGEILISHLGNGTNASPGGFISLTPNISLPGTDAVVTSKYHILTKTGPDSSGDNNDNYNYDFVIDECNSILVCTSWGPPSSFDPGFNAALPYGRAIRVFAMPGPGGPTLEPNALTLVESFATTASPLLGGPEDGEGIVPLEVRRVHTPGKQVYFVGVTLPGAIDLIQFKNNTWTKTVVISPTKIAADCVTLQGHVPKGNLGNGLLPIPLVTDITLSEDDKYLYVSCWLAGCVLQYDVTNPALPIYKGGYGNLGGVTKINPGVNEFNPFSYEWDTNKQFAGGPQMLRLEQSGRVLYVTNSLFSSWDDQFYPGTNQAQPQNGSISDNGGMLIKLKTGVVKDEIIESMSVDTDFGTDGVIAFKNLTHPKITGPFTSRCHECHIMGVTH